jgi:cleavage and polyadenylation specificity factor subunit 5
LRPGEDETQGLKRKLSTHLAPPNPTNNPSLHISWDIGDCVGVFWRPNFDTLFYPYLPPHITRPKECRRIFIIPLPEKALFALIKGCGKLVAVPLFDLYDNPAKYGPLISALPSMLSRFKLTLVGSQQTVNTQAPSLELVPKDEQQEEQWHREQ